METKTRTVVPGLIAGAVGAAVLAIWFLVVDLAAGMAFRTPAMIGSALLGMDALETSPGLIALFTLLHLGAFLVVGMAAAWALSQLERAPNVLLGLVLGFVLFNAVFFGSAAVTGLDVVAQLGWVEVLVGNILAGIAMVSVLHQAELTRQVAWGQALREGTVLREGLLAGFLAGFAVAVWFLLLDLAMGRALFTPSAIGSVLYLGASGLDQVQVSGLMAAAYTPIHFAVFMAIGVVAAAVAQQAERQPPVLLGALLLFAAAEAFALGLIAIVAEFLLGTLAWWSIAVGNLVGVLTIAGYLWATHPRLRTIMGPQSDRIKEPA